MAPPRKKRGSTRKSRPTAQTPRASPTAKNTRPSASSRSRRRKSKAGTTSNTSPTTTALTAASVNDNLSLPFTNDDKEAEESTAASTRTLSTRAKKKSNECCHIGRTIGKVQFGTTPQVTVHTVRGDHKKHELSAKWYSKSDLKMLLDYEVRITMRCNSKDVEGKKMGRFCCKRGLERQLEDVQQGQVMMSGATIRRSEYVKIVLLMQEQLRRQLPSLDAVSEKLRRKCRAHTKEDRKKSYQLGLQDASDVKFMNASASGLLTMDKASDHFGRRRSHSVWMVPPKLGSKSQRTVTRASLSSISSRQALFERQPASKGAIPSSKQHFMGEDMEEDRHRMSLVQMARLSLRIKKEGR